MTVETQFPLTVYYDRSCPMCAAEMHALEKAAGSGRLLLVDCSAPEFDAASRATREVTRDALMSRLHARDGSGRWMTALDAYEAIYLAAGYRRIARLWGSWLLRPVFDRAYLWVARNRNAISRLGMYRVFGWMLRR